MVEEQTEDQPPLVLVVDDEAPNLQLVGSILRKRGYEITFARSGAQALESVQKNPPDLILLDIMMPEMDGYEVCRRLKADPNTAHLPVIFLTAKAQTEDIVRGFQTGGVDYVKKPFEAEELLARVKTHIQLKQLRALLSVCSYCNKIRNEKDEWEKIQPYLHRHAGVDFSHGLCPECFQKLMESM